MPVSAIVTTASGDLDRRYNAQVASVITSKLSFFWILEEKKGIASFTISKSGGGDP